MQTMIASPKYGIPCRCLSANAPCEKICQVCIEHAEKYFENEWKRQLAESIRNLEYLGYKVELENPRFDFLKE